MTAIVHDSYKVILDAIRLGRHFVSNGEIRRERLAGNQIIDLEVDKAGEVLDDAKRQIDDLFVVALVSFFERRVRDYLKTEFGDNFDATNDTRQGILGQVKKDIDFWTLSDQVVSVFPTVNKNLKGQVVQVIRYRDWVAHGHRYGEEERLPDSNVTPERAAQVLNQFIVEAGL